MTLLLVGDASSIFFVKYVESLKKILDVHVTVYSPFPDKRWYKEYPYDEVLFDNFCNTKIGKFRFLWPFVFRYKFHKYLKERGERFDIMHFHWLIESWTLNTSEYHHYANKVGCTFWGGELESQKLLFSHKLYLYKLGNLLNVSDFGIGSTAKSNTLVQSRYPEFVKKCRLGIYGSSIVDALTTMSETRKDACTFFSIPEDKITVMLGYSGKIIHRHCEIIEILKSNKKFDIIKDKIHFVVNMTRGSWPEYTERVNEALKQTGCSYTFIKNQYMTDKDVALLRKATMLLFQVTDFDEISTSIVEALSAGTLMIAGNWYPNYKVLREYGFKWLEVSSIENAVNVFYEVFDNMSRYNEILNNNQLVGIEYFSWAKCIRPWANLYQEIM